MKILVTGGAGYIGSHTAKSLKNAGYQPVVVDNLIYGHEWAVKWGPLYKINISETQKLEEVILQENIKAVIHFAAYAYVGESVKDPLKYYDNNLVGTLSLLKAMKNQKIDKIVFSSTCATYGIPSHIPINEDELQNPINPYGRSKWMVEKVLQDLAYSEKFNSICLRYFNAAGADPELEIGEDHDPETHLIPNAIQAALSSNRTLSVFGHDYPTADGSCVRDYIHVTDLAKAHVLAVEHLLTNKTVGFEFMNLGTGKGTSVLEIIRHVEKITGKKINYQIEARREGDPAVLVARIHKAIELLNWRPQYSEIEPILTTAIEWHKKHFRD